MPRLTETLYKSGGARNPTVNFKKFMNYTKTYQNNKIFQANVLGNRVSLQKPYDKEAVCREEMLVLMACWKKHEFKENTCSEEFKNFSRCSSEIRAKKLKERQFADSAELGKVSEDGKMNPRQTNRLLQMYPQPPYKITITHGIGFPRKEPLVFEGKKDDDSQRGIPANLWGRQTKRNK